MAFGLPFKKWNNVHAVLMLLSMIPVVLFRSTSLLSILCIISFSWYITSNADLLRSHRPFAGYANWITFCRLCCALAIGFFHPILGNPAIAVLGTTIVIMDWFDGYAARKFNTASPWGSYFDMETDAFFVCLMASTIYIKGYLGPWILLTGYMRYLYVVLQIVMKNHDQEEGSKFGQTVAVLLFCSLITPFVFSRTIYMPAVALTSLLVLISFSYSFASARKVK